MRNIQGLPPPADPSSDSLGRLDGQCPGLFYVACGINARMVFVPTGHADKHRLRPAASRIHNAAFGACLRSVCGIDPRKLAAAFCELVIEHVRKHAPALVKDTMLREEVDWLKAAPVHALQNALRAVEHAFQRFFAGLCAFPKPRKKFLNDSFTLPAEDLTFRRLTRTRGGTSRRRQA